MMHTEKVIYYEDGKKLHGYIAYDTLKTGPRPAVLVAHAWKGQDDFARMKAQALAKLGYVGFAVDNYCAGSIAETDDEAARLMMPLFTDRALLQTRMKKAFDAICSHPLVDTARVGVIGFCFGGLAAIELLRSGVNLQACVSFHAVLGSAINGIQARCVAIATGIRGSLLMLHGHDDPLVSAEDISAIQDEMTQAHVDWQMHIYGHTSHAFTNRDAKDKSAGLIYNALSDARSWQSMVNFLSEKFL